MRALQGFLQVKTPIKFKLVQIRSMTIIVALTILSRLNMQMEMLKIMRT
jgi:hypothetical protein